MMKKFKYILLSLFALYPTLVSAQLGFEAILPSETHPADWGWETLGQTIGNVVELALILSAGVAIIFIIVGGYQYIFAFGNPEAIEHAKNTIIWAIVGLVLALSAVLIMQYVEYFIGEPSELNIPETNPREIENIQSSDETDSSGEDGSAGEDERNSEENKGSSDGSEKYSEDDME